MTRYLAYAIIAVLASTSLTAQWIVMDPAADSLILAGQRHVYNVEFDEAQQMFNEVTKRYPTQPAGFFVDAMIDWWRLTIGQRSPAIEASFLKKIDRVLAVCDKQLQSNPKHIFALFFKGGALGYRGRFNATKQNYLSALDDARQALSILNECQRLAPTNHDILLGTGLYNYFAAVLPEQVPAIKPLMMFLSKGDKVIGLAQLKSTARQARYASVEAKVVLVDAYMGFEKNYLEAIDVASELRASYPGNPKFHIDYARCLTNLWRLDTAYAVWDEVLQCNVDGRTGYRNRLIAREALYNLGNILFLQNKELPKAILYLKRSADESKVINKVNATWQYPWSLVRLGQIHDMLGKRKEAVAFYKQAQAASYTSTNLTETITKYLNSPYRR